jgi:hypothetical protein
MLIKIKLGAGCAVKDTEIFILVGEKLGEEREMFYPFGWGAGEGRYI